MGKSEKERETTLEWRRKREDGKFSQGGGENKPLKRRKLSCLSKTGSEDSLFVWVMRVMENEEEKMKGLCSRGGLFQLLVMRGRMPEGEAWGGGGGKIREMERKRGINGIPQRPVWPKKKKKGSQAFNRQRKKKKEKDQFPSQKKETWKLIRGLKRKRGRTSMRRRGSERKAVLSGTKKGKPAKVRFPP